ncbi:hypothetical protein [Mycobacterium sp. 236(2023)]|uniref:hypothetical protein n=1 Tax=Mycobacterium sp. 236(2023) TaxID=3038163 RepID=UPI00241544DC|nr:hypothetical protein [Mycobacterium sp. 236(2023)]MDG4664555.1 hypothetical protein [Mycobacterium sp. 236(2023)]
MSSSIRPWVTAGIAVVGVGVIAVAPFEPLPPGDSIQITNSAVELNTTPRPLDYYPQVVMRSLENASDRLAEYLAAPLPIVTAVLESQYDAITDIVSAGEDRDAVAVVNALVGAVALPVVNLTKVVGSGEPFDMIASLIIRLALPIVSGVLAAGSTVGDVVESLLDLDVVGAVSAITNLPARIVDGILNGRVDPAGNAYFGLLAPVADEPVTDQLTGPVSFLIDSLQGIGDTISAPAPVGVGEGPADLPLVGSATVTVPVTPPAGAPSSAGPGTPNSDRSDDPPTDPPDAGGVDEPPSSDPEDSAPEESVDPEQAEPGGNPTIGSEPASVATASDDAGSDDEAGPPSSDGPDASTSTGD